VAIGVNAEGYREILGICEGAKEDKSGWSAFLRHLVDRGRRGVELIISDACRGLVESIAEYLPDARWQRRAVHFYRNVFSHVPASKVREVSHMLKAIHAQETRGSAEAQATAGRAAITRPRPVTRVSRHGNASTGALSSRGRSAVDSGLMASFRAALAVAEKPSGAGVQLRCRELPTVLAPDSIWPGIIVSNVCSAASIGSQARPRIL
jgi:hypothetical protein